MTTAQTLRCVGGGPGRAFELAADRPKPEVRIATNRPGRQQAGTFAAMLRGAEP